MNYLIALAAGLLALSACATPPAEDSMASQTTAAQSGDAEKSVEKETGEENCKLVKSTWSNRTEKVCE